MKLSFVSCLGIGLILSFLSVYADASSQVDEITEQLPVPRFFVRREEGYSGTDVQRRRRLFYWGNILYVLRVCHESSGWCPDPHCDGPLKPPSCNKSSKSSSGGGSSSGSGNNYSGNSDSSNSNGDYSGQYSGTSSSSGDDDFNYSGGSSVSGESSGEGGSAGRQESSEAIKSFKAFWLYLIMGAASASIIAGFLMKKRDVDELEEGDLGHELNNSVAKRIDLVSAGKSVPSIYDDSEGPRFVELGKEKKVKPRGFLPVPFAGAKVPPKSKRGKSSKALKESIEMEIRDGVSYSRFA